MTSQHVIKNAIQNRSYSLMTGTLNVQIYKNQGTILLNDLRKT